MAGCLGPNFGVELRDRDLKPDELTEWILAAIACHGINLGADTGRAKRAI